MRKISALECACAVCLLVAVLLPLLCSAQKPDGMPTIRHIVVVPDDDAVKVEITASQPVAPQTRVLTEPDRIVIDFPGAVPAAHLKGLRVNEGGIKAVRTGLFESNPPVTRVVLDLAAPSEYQLVPSGNTVIVKLGSPPLNPAPAARRVAPAVAGGLFSAPKVKVDLSRENDLGVTNRESTAPAPVAGAVGSAPLTPASPVKIDPPREDDLGVPSRQLAPGSSLIAPAKVAPAAPDSHAETPNALAEAERLRDAGQFEAAAKLLRAQISQQPDDGDAERLLAQTLYWLKDTAGARAVYDTALVQHPDDSTMRLQYARMLVDTGKRFQARKLLTPLLSIPATRADAETLLGQLAYRDGDLTTARRLFADALADNPNQEAARRQLGEILDSTAPWVRLSAGGWHDDQPLDRLALGLESGWFPTPLTKLSARVQPMHYWTNGATRTVGDSEVAVSNYAPRMRLETEFAGGSVFRSLNGGSWLWAGRAGLGFRLPEHVTLRGRIERSPYFWTQASLNTPVMVQTATGLIHWDDPRGWLGEAAYQQEHYHDNNTIRTEYAWLLAPVVRRGGVKLQAGYAFSDANANQSRFVLAQPNQPYPPTDPRFDLAGIYAPYYTPIHQLMHSATAAFTAGLTRRVTVHLNGSYAIHATQDAPFFAAPGGQVLLNSVATTFSPWNVRGSFTIPLGSGLILEPTGEAGRAAFYSWAAGGFQITYHFKTPKGTAQ